jgi:two-component system response regulator
MNRNIVGAVEILLVEDDPRDAELTIRALKKHGPANQLFHVADGRSSNKIKTCKSLSPLY